MRNSLAFYCVLIGAYFLPVCQSTAQPYIDLISARYVMSPGPGILQHAEKETILNYAAVSSTVPLQFRNTHDLMLFSPFFERWSSTITQRDAFRKYHYSAGLPVSFLKSFTNPDWNMLSTVIIRINDLAIRSDGQYQFGGALLVTHYLRQKHITYKVGVYLNGEFFGLFIVPLLGIDWKINDKTNLFGVLPAGITLDRKMDSRFHAGLTGRTFTNSYRDSGQTYFRVDENQLGVFADIYISRHLVLNLEGGHSLFRKIRTGIKHKVRIDWDAGDGFYFKTMLAYRIWLR